MIKDISNLLNRNLKDIVAVDDNFSPFNHCLGNLVPILPFYANREDKELPKVAKFLEFVHDLEEHVEFLEDHFKLEKALQAGSAEEALKFFKNPTFTLNLN